jgi:ureidoacrylate peracid hydrolase
MSDPREGGHQVEEGPRRGLDHLLLQTDDLGLAESFYIGFLGFTVKKRETFRDGRPLVVTEQGLGLTSGRPPGAGPVEHIAFRVTGIEELARRAGESNVPIVMGPTRTEYGLSLYVEDPDGNKIELFGQPDPDG